MTVYARSRTLLEVDPYSTYVNPQNHHLSLSSTPGKKLVDHLISAATAGTTFDLSPYTTITGLIIENESTTNYVLAEFYVQVGSRAAGNLAFTKGAPDKIEDQDDGDFTGSAMYASAGMYVRIANSEDGGVTDALHLIQSVQDKDATYDEITLASDNGLAATNADDDTATLSFESRVKLKIPAAQHVVYFGNVVVASDLVLRANTAACDIALSILGT